MVIIPEVLHCGRLGNGIVISVGITPVTCTQPTQYLYLQCHAMSLPIKRSPKMSKTSQK